MIIELHLKKFDHDFRIEELTGLKMLDGGIPGSIKQSGLQLPSFLLIR
jgi:hypothetical protein